MNESVNDYNRNENNNLPVYYQRPMKLNTTMTNQNCYGTDFQSYYNERAQYMNRKFQTLNLANANSEPGRRTVSTNCPVHSRRDLNKLEECYWAQWKPSKTTSIFKNATVQNKSVDTSTGSSINCMNTNQFHCPNCHRFIRKPRCHCYRNFMNNVSSSAIDYSDVHPMNCMCLCHHRLCDDTSDCECFTGQDGETVDFGFTDASKEEVSELSKKPIKEEKKMYDKCVCCPCEVSKKTETNSIVEAENLILESEGKVPIMKPLYVNKSCITRSSDLITTPVHGSCVNSLLSQSAVPTQVSPKVVLGVDLDSDGTDENIMCGTCEPCEFDTVNFVEGSSTPGTTSNTASLNAQKTLPLSSNPNSILTQSTCEVRNDEEGEEEIQMNCAMNCSGRHQQFPCQQYHVIQQNVCCEKCICARHKAENVYSTSTNPADKDLTNNPKKTKNISNCFVDEQKFLVTKVAHIMTSEPMAEIKRQAERIVVTALEVEAEKQLQRLQEKRNWNNNNTYVPTEKVIVEIDSTEIVSTIAEKQIEAKSVQASSGEIVKDQENPADTKELQKSQIMQKQSQASESTPEQRNVQEQLRQLELQKEKLEEQQRQIHKERELQLQQQLLLKQQAEQQRLQQQLQRQQPQCLPRQQRQQQQQKLEQQQLDEQLRQKLQQALFSQTVMEPNATAHVQVQNTVQKTDFNLTNNAALLSPAISQKSAVSTAAARVSTVLRHSYPLGGRNGGRKSTGNGRVSLVGNFRK